MLTYKRISNTDNVLIYEYYPNGDETDPGIIRFEKGRPPHIVKEARKDVKRYFAYHAMNGIDISKKEGTVAWY